MLPAIYLLSILTGALSQCPPGTSPLYTNGNQVATCSPQNSCSCSTQRAGYFCQYSSQHTRYVCCGVTSSQCPNSAALISDSGTTVTCGTNSCATGYTCNQGVCCANLNTPECNNNNGGVTPCLSGQVLINGICMFQVAVGSLCQRNEQCLGGSNCLSGRCQCTNGYYPQNGQCISNNGQCQIGTTLVDSKCLSLASPGSSCVNNNQCIDNSYCNNGICTCNTAANMVNGYCIPYSGGPCQQTQTMINGQCVTYSTVGGSCMAEAQCVGGSTCQVSQCVCRTGYSAMYGYCIQNPTSNIGCQPNQVLINGYCYNQVSQGGSCMFSEQCLNNAYCNNGVCTAGNGINCNAETQILVNRQCLSLVGLNEICTHTEQCLSASQCINSRCQCSSSQTQTNGVCTGGNGCSFGQVFYNSQCLSVVSVGQNCQAHIQCGGNSRCIQSYCRCPTGTTINNGVCSNGGTPGQNCQSGMIFILNQCYPLVQNGGQCSYSQQCQGTNMQCITGRCQSNPCGNNNQVYVNGQCLQTVQINSICNYNEQCLGNSQCTSGYCTCPTGTTNNNGQCLTNNIPGGITCGINQVNVNGQCLYTVQIGASCSYNEQCLYNSQCINRFCNCPNGSTLNNGVCSNGGTPGQNCQSGMIFIINQCYPLVQNGGQCSYSQQCQGTNMQCITGRCQSNPCGNNNQVYVNGQCLQTVQINSICNYNEQCLGNSQCTSGYCTCPTGTTNNNGQCLTNNIPGGITCGINQVSINNKCYPLVSVGGTCTYNQQCQGTNVQCISNRCQTGGSNGNNMCSANEQPAYTNGQLVDCLKSACPSSSYCTYSNVASQYICCKTSTNTNNPGSQLTCTNPAHTVVLQNNSPINCLLSNCPTSSYCDYDRQFSQYMCCQSSSTTPTNNICSGNYYQNSNGSPYVCTADSSCQFGNYRYCRRASSSVTYSVCCDRS